MDTFGHSDIYMNDGKCFEYIGFMDLGSWYASNGWGHHKGVVSCVENTPRIASRVKCPWMKDPKALEEERRAGVGYFRAWLSRGLT